MKFNFVRVFVLLLVAALEAEPVSNNLKRLREKRALLVQRYKELNTKDENNTVERSQGRTRPTRKRTQGHYQSSLRNKYNKTSDSSRTLSCSPTIYYVPIYKVATEANNKFVNKLCGCKAGDCAYCQEKKLCQVKRNADQFCYTFLRDPISRFFSQYAEMSERAVKYYEMYPNETTSCPGCVGPGVVLCKPVTNVSLRQYTAPKCCCDGYRPIAKSGTWVSHTSVTRRILAMLNEIKKKGFFDAHLYPQSDTFRMRSHKTDDLPRLDQLFNVIPRAIRLGYCENLDKVYYLNASREAFDDLGMRVRGGGVLRLRRSHSRASMPSRQLAHYYMDTKTIPPAAVNMITQQVCQIYLEDFCRFRFSIPRVCEKIVTPLACKRMGYPVTNLIDGFY
eukprot:m.64417 g.64417  ORF g.64417 m.64417 type:complete len:392 (+) comp11649_c0_seq4:127-1302(+)